MRRKMGTKKRHASGATITLKVGVEPRTLCARIVEEGGARAAWWRAIRGERGRSRYSAATKSTEDTGERRRKKSRVGSELVTCKVLQLHR